MNYRLHFWFFGILFSMKHEPLLKQKGKVQKLKLKAKLKAQAGAREDCLVTVLRESISQSYASYYEANRRPRCWSAK